MEPHRIAAIIVGVSGALRIGWELRNAYMKLTSHFPRKPYISSDPLSFKLFKQLVYPHDPLGVTEAEAEAYCKLFQVPYKPLVTAREVGHLFEKYNLAIIGKRTPTSEQTTAAGFMYGIRGVHDIPLRFRDRDGVFETARNYAGSLLETLELPRYRP